MLHLVETRAWLDSLEFGGFGTGSVLRDLQAQHHQVEENVLVHVFYIHWARKLLKGRFANK